MKKITKEIINQINEIYRKGDSGYNYDVIDPNYNFNDPFMYIDGMYTSSMNYEEAYENFGDAMKESLNVHSLEEIKKLDPEYIISELYKDFEREGADVYIEVNDLDSHWFDMMESDYIYKNIGYLDDSDIQIHNKVAHLLGLDEFLIKDKDLTTDSKQKQICDSFSKRYNK